MKKPLPVERPWYRDRALFVRSEDERRWRETRETPNVVEFKVPASAPVIEQPVAVVPVEPEPVTVLRDPPEDPPPASVEEPPPPKPWWKRLLRL